MSGVFICVGTMLKFYLTLIQTNARFYFRRKEYIMDNEIEFLKRDDLITIERIKRELKASPPGSSLMNQMPMEFMWNCPFYIEYLLKKLEETERPWWQKTYMKIKKALSFKTPSVLRFSTQNDLLK